MIRDVNPLHREVKKMTTAKADKIRMWSSILLNILLLVSLGFITGSRGGVWFSDSCYQLLLKYRSISEYLETVKLMMY